MAEVSISDLTQLNTPLVDDVYPVVSNNITQKIRYDTLYNDISSRVVVGKYTPITTFNDSQTFLSNASGNWQTAYTTVTANSAAWGAAAPIGYTLFREASSVISPNNGTNVYALSVYSLSANVDIALIAKGTGATLAQIPDNSATGGGKRGQYATDLQKFRTQATQVASGLYTVIAGGVLNTASGNNSTICGGYSNKASNDNSFVGGGYENIASGQYSTVAGGVTLTASGNYSIVGGGESNIASGNYSIVGGGRTNKTTNGYSTIAGGWINTASGEYSTVAGGASNTASGNRATIAGGVNNTVTGDSSSVLGGEGNNTNNFSNVHLIGSSLTAVSADYTYVNNISSQGTVVSNTTTSTTISAATYQGIQAIKAWVNFDGTGSVGSNATLNASYNINFVRKTNIGLYTVVFSSSSIFANANYIMSGTASGNLLLTPVLSADSRTAAPSLKTSLSCMVAILTGSATTTNRADSKEIGLMFIGS